MIRILFVLCCMLVVTGCSSRLVGGVPKEEALQKIKWTYGKQSIQLVINASDNLNAYNGEPHTLMLAVVQFSDPNTFRPYIQSADKMVALLVAGNKAPGWLSTEQVFIEPGQRHNILIDRAQGAQYVGVVAGYNDLVPQKSARSYELGIEYQSKGIFIKKYEALPSPLQIYLSLGDHAIIDTAVSNSLSHKKVTEPTPRVLPQEVSATTQDTPQKKH